MLEIVRAEDGELFQFDVSFRDLERLGNLELFLQEQTGVDQSDVLAYLPDGTRLTTANIRELAGSQESRIYVYNKYFLDYELEEVLNKLVTQPRLQPPIEACTPPLRPSQLSASYIHAAHFHQDVINHVAESITLQHEALGISSHTLDLHILSLSETYDSFTQIASRELNKQEMLLRSLDIDLATIQRIQVHPDFLGEKFNASGKTRTLGSYVDSSKMRSVSDSCQAIHAFLKGRFEKAHECMKRLSDGSEKVRQVLQDSQARESAAASTEKARDALERITDIASRLEDHLANTDALQELVEIDAALREEVKAVTELKNDSSLTCVCALREISALNNDIMELPVLMGSLQSEFRAKTKFSHIQRLHTMPYAYGATLIELVRRKEFAHFFQQRAQTIFEIMAKLSSSEKKRRQIYRSEVHGQLPFDEPIPDEPVPSLKDFPSINGRYEGFTLERSDIESFMQTLIDLEADLRATNNDSAELEGALEDLRKLFDRMNNLELTFDRIVERSLLSASTLSSSRRRILAIEESTAHDLSEKITAIEREKGELQQSLSDEQARYQSEIAHLRAELERTIDSETQYKERTAALEEEVSSLKSRNELDLQARHVLEERHAELLAEAEALRKGQMGAREEAITHAKEADVLRQELARTRSEYESVKELEAENSQKIAQLVETQTTTIRSLEEARNLGEDLLAQLQDARMENEEVNRALRDVRDQKDHLLRVQSLEHQRLMRDHIAEADGDRAVLEQQFFEAKAQLEQREQQLKQMKSEADILQADITGLREEQLRTEHELREARHVERVLRNDLSEGRASQSDYEQKIAARDRLVAQLLDVASGFRDSHSKAFAVMQPVSIHPSTVLKNGTNPSESIVFAPPPRLPMSPLREESTPIDYTDPVAALEILRSYDLDAFAETVTKVVTVSRKWQRLSREYRDRSKGRITFRNFAKGDLALFLPTRNSPSKPWAAFNVSFPHYFLNATGRLAEQLKTREWIVARITSITERVVDVKDPTTNPYGLGDGIKYFLLEVEDWTKPGNDNSRRRKSTGQKGQDRPTSPPPLERPISPPLPDDRQSQTNATAAEPLGPTRSPNSHLFPVRTRSNSNSAGPSSLSRLLAQASADTPLDTIPGSPSPTRSRTPSPSTRGAPAPPSPTRNTAIAHSPSVSSPLRPGSRASGTSSTRLSFSGGRIAPFPRGSSSSGTTGSSKAAPTTALSSDLPVASPPSSSSTSSHRQVNGTTNNSISDDLITSPNRLSTPSPTLSASEGMSNVLGRRRTTSEHVPASTTTSAVNRQATVGSPTTATSTLASLVGMTMSLGRRKRVSSSKLNGNLPTVHSDPDSPPPAPSTGSSTQTTPSVAETLRRLQS